MHPSSSPHHRGTQITPVKLRPNPNGIISLGHQRGSGALSKRVKAVSFLQWQQQTFGPFLNITVNLWVTCHLRDLIILKSNHTRKYMFIQTTVKLPDPDCNGSEKWWSGVSSIRSLCLKLVQMCPHLYHPTCIFLSNFLSGKVRESWTGEGGNACWSYFTALFQHDLSPTQLQVHTSTLDL